MNKINIQVCATVTSIAFLILFLVPPLPAHAQNGADIYKSKCAACHGPDGSGSAMGTKLGAHDFHSAGVQKMSDEELSGVITNGRNKMPAYGKSLKADDIKGLVTYIRSLAPAK